MRTLCDAYYEEHESHYRAFLDISELLHTDRSNTSFAHDTKMAPL